MFKKNRGVIKLVVNKLVDVMIDIEVFIYHHYYKVFPATDTNSFQKNS
jgi:hypothetical protein